MTLRLIYLLLILFHVVKKSKQYVAVRLDFYARGPSWKSDLIGGLELSEEITL